MSIPTMNIENSFLLKFADNPHASMIHILLRDQRTTWIKEGNLCLLEKYITALYIGDTKMIQTASAYLLNILAGLTLVGIVAG